MNPFEQPPFDPNAEPGPLFTFRALPVRET